MRHLRQYCIFSNPLSAASHPHNCVTYTMSWRKVGRSGYKWLTAAYATLWAFSRHWFARSRHLHIDRASLHRWAAQNADQKAIAADDCVDLRYPVSYYI